MTDLEKKLARLMLQNGNDFENFEQQNFTAAVAAAAQSPTVRAAMQKTTQAAPGLSMGAYAEQGSPASVAVLDILIKRKSITIDGALPVPIFGANAYQTKYRTVIGLTGYVYTITTIDNTSDGLGLVYTFSDGTNTDTVEIRCNQVPYANLLEATKTTLIKVSSHKLQVADVANIAQFNVGLTAVYSSLFGKTEKNDISLSSYNDEKDTNFRVRTIPVVMDFDAERTLFIPIIKVDELEVTYNAFVAIYKKTASANGF